jgi:metallopeptidase MepB
MTDCTGSAEIFSIDLFYTGFEGNMLDEQRGRKYRYTILKPGGSRPEWKTLTDFLGREPNANAYNKEKGWVN